MLAMLALAGIAQAANDKLVVQDVSMEAGSSVTLNVALENETTNLMGFQCDIVLPEGLTLKLKNNGKPTATLGSRFEDTGHSISSSVTSSGAYRFIATSLDGEAIPETSGTLFTVTLQADASLAPGTTLACLVKNIEFNTQDNQKMTFSNVSFTVTIPGDTPPDPDPEPDPEPVNKNRLVVQDMSMEAGSSVTLEVALENEITNLMGFQCDIELPEGLTLKLKNNGKPAATLGSRFEDTEHTISSSVTSSGAYRFIATSLDGEAIPGTSGTLFTVTLQADASLTPGTKLACSVKNIEFNTQDNQKVVFNNVTFNVSIPGDVETLEVTVTSCSREYGEANPTFEYTVEGEGIDGTPEITCNATPNSPVGTYDIVISQGTVTNSNVTFVNGTLTITKAPLTITAGEYTKKQGEQNPEFTLTYEGFKNDETSEVLTTQPTVSCEATEASAPGEYDVTVSGAEAQNYEITHVNGKLTVTDAESVKVTAKSYTREYGDANPTFEYTVEGAALEGTPEIICEATETSPVGEYPIIIKKGGVTNYNDTYVNGVLTITKAPLTIKAGNYTKKQGEQNPEFTLTYEGFKNNENSEVLTTQPTVSCEATEASASGEYDVTVSGAEAQNYEISYVNGKLTITDLLIQTLDLTELPAMTYGDGAFALPQHTTEGLALTWSVGDATIANITDNSLTILKAGTTTVTAKQAGNENYKPFEREFPLTIGKAMLTITANNCTKQVGEENPELTVRYSGFKYNDDSSSLISQPTVTTTATTDSPAGTYPITVSGAASDNYEFTYVGGTLTVTSNSDLAIISFEDETVKELCVTNWDSDGDGELSTSEAEAVTDLGTVFSSSDITSFNELAYFTGLTSIGDNAFNSCQYLASITIPKSVTSIGQEAFSSSGLNSISIPNNVITIGVSAFNGCIDLISVKMGKKVSDIGDEAFNGCSSLTSITLPYMLESIGNKAFYGCALISITIPDNVTEIGEEAFKNNSSLTTVILGEDITEIKQQTFFGCTSLSSIIIPEEVTSIGDNAFNGCALTSITIPDNVEEIGEYAFANNGHLTTAILGEGIMEIEKGTFNACPSLTSVVIQDGVTTIGDETFGGCNSLTSVKLPETLTSLGESVFPNSLKSIELPNSFTVIPDNLFYDNKFQYIKLGNNVKSIGKNAFGSDELVIEISTLYPPKIASDAFPNVEYLSDINVILPSAAAETAYRKVAVWKEMTFSNQSNIAEVTVDTPGELSWELLDECGIQPAKVVELKVNGIINAADFSQMLVNMKSLLRLDLSGCNITEIPDNALNGKTQLQKLTLPTRLQTIGNSAFQGCVYLTGELDLPSTLTSIGESAFVGTDYTSVKMPYSLKTIGDYAFNNVPIKQRLQIPDRVISVGAYAFAGTQINGLVFFDGVTSIGDYAFDGTPIQGHVTIPDGVTYLGKGAFRNSQLSTVFLPNSVTELSEGLFQGCPNLNLVYVPDNYTAFDGSAFDGCGALTILRLSANLESMGEYSFQSTPLEYIKVPSQVEVLSKGVLKNCKSLASLSLPANLKTVEAEALNGCTALRNLSVEAIKPPVIKNRSAIRGINTDLCIISIPTQSYKDYVLAEYWGQFVQMRNDIAVETSGNGEIAFESVEEDEESPNLRPSFARGRRRVSTLASEEESLTYANNGSSVYVPQQGQVRFYIIPAEGEEILSATLDGEDIMPYIVDGVYTATADKRNAKLVVVFSGGGQGSVAQAGDVNGDGDIDIVDVTSTIGYVIHQVPANFIFKAADVNNDGTVDIVDVTSIIDMIINKSKNVKEFKSDSEELDPQ